jgi:hypothetical protein
MAAPAGALVASEQTVMVDPTAGYLPGRFTMKLGTLTLSNQRLLFKRSPFWLGLISFFFLRNRLTLVDLPLADISVLAPSTFGRNKKVIQVQARDGREMRFLINRPPEEWTQAFNQLTGR